MLFFSSNFLSRLDFVHIVLTFRKNNFFVNLTSNFLGHTIIKFSASKHFKSRRVLKLLLDKIVFFLSSFSRHLRPSPFVKVLLKGYPKSSFSAIKSFFKKLKKPPISFHNFVPVVHNGCRPPLSRF